MKIYHPITNGGKFYVQFGLDPILHEDLRGRPIQYRSLEGAKKTANKLNLRMKNEAFGFIRGVHISRRAVDHINGDIADNRLENLRVVTLKGNRK